jgi:hypothetical protein
MVFRVWGHPWDIQFLVQGTLAGSVLIANSNLLVDQSMATQLSAGGLSTLRYAYRINDLPLQLIVLALSKAILPFVSEQVCDGDSSGLRRIFAQSLASLGLIAFPVIALVMLFAGDIVVVLLRRGAFDAEAARHTVLALRCYTGDCSSFPMPATTAPFFVPAPGPCPVRHGYRVRGTQLRPQRAVFAPYGGAEAIALSSSVTAALLATAFLFQLRGPLGLTRPIRLGIGLLPPALATLAAVVPCLLLRGRLGRSPCRAWCVWGWKECSFWSFSRRCSCSARPGWRKNSSPFGICRVGGACSGAGPAAPRRADQRVLWYNAFTGPLRFRSGPAFLFSARLKFDMHQSWQKGAMRKLRTEIAWDARDGVKFISSRIPFFVLWDAQCCRTWNVLPHD